MKTLLLAISALLASAGFAPAAASYTLTDLGTLGGNTSAAQAIDAQGRVFGASNLTTDGPLHLFLYDAGGALTDLGSLGGSTLEVTAVNGSAQVVGYATTPGDAETHAFLFADGTLAAISLFGGTEDYAYDIDDSGAVVGSARQNGQTVLHAFLHGEVVTLDLANELGFLTDKPSHAYGINSFGAIVGSYPVGDNPHAFLYEADPNDPMPTAIDLGTLGGTGSLALAINDAGQIIGNSLDSNGDIHGFLYHENQSPKMKDLGTLGGSQSLARAINASGSVVGEAAISNGDVHAFLHHDGAMSDLNDLIPAGSGWVLTRAHDINDAGQIVGEGIHPSGATRAWMLTPVAPTPAATPSQATSPVVQISGPKKIVTSKASLLVKGRATGAVATVLIRVGKKTIRATGTTSWRARVRLQPGRNKLSATATGPGGTSAPARITVIRKARANTRNP